MIQRCTNPNRDDYKHYGGRGIKVCAYWLEFKNFLADMGPRPPGTSLERKNNDMGYEPGNCLWADRVTQARNSRQVVWVELDGQHKRLVEWCAELGVSINTVRDRVKYHDMGYAEALTAAPQKRGYHGRFVPREDVFTLEAQEEAMSKMPTKDRPLEKNVKIKIRKLLTEHEWFWWNVPMNSYAKSGISDIHAVKKGMFMVVEGKRDNNEDPTALQKGFLGSIAAEDHFAFVVDADNLGQFELFLGCLDRSMNAVAAGGKPTPEDGAGMLNAIREMTRKY